MSPQSRSRCPSLLVLAMGAALFAPDPAAGQQLTVSGQLRPRYEVQSPALTSGASRSFTSMRTRLAVEAALERGVTVFIQPQDVRIWGDEDHPLRDFSAEGIDFHQAWLRIEPDIAPWLTATGGRMEVILGGHRLVGNVDWVPQGQAFDGVGLDVSAGRASFKGLVYTISDAAAAGVTDNRALYGTYGTIDDVGPGALDVYWLYDRLRGDVTTSEHFVGGRYVFGGAINGRAEATIATGSRDDVDISAYMLGVRVGTTFADERLSAVLWYDRLSGDDPDTPELEVFSTLYGTNHKFYGFADLFLNIPAHTGNAGLQDLAVKLGWQASPTTRAGLDLHSFRAASGSVLSDSRFGEELDLTLQHRYSADLVATTGFSYVIQGDGLAEIGRLTEDLTWFYVMVDVSF